MDAAPAALSAPWPEQDNKVPQEIYLDPDLYRAELDRIFRGPTWHLVAHESEVPEPGDFKTHVVGDVPIVLARGRDGALHALVNACAHRGAQVVHEPFGNAAGGVFRCIYHAWTFAADGCCTGVSLPDTFPEDFRKEEYGLPRARLETLRGLVFVTFDDATPALDEYVGDLVEGVDLALGDGELRLLGYQKAIVECNWKLYAENMYDGYHTQALHKAHRMLKTRATGETRAPRYESYGHVLHVYRAHPPQEAELLRDMSVVEIRSRAEPVNTSMNVFPQSMVSHQLDTLFLRYCIPRGVDRTEVQYAVFAPAGEPDELVAHRVRQGSNLFGPQGFISLEDAAALARMQAGSPARGENVVLKGTPKRFPPYRMVDEAAIRHFYGAYRRLMRL